MVQEQGQGRRAYSEVTGFRIQEELEQEFVVKYEEDLQYGAKAPADRSFFTVEQGLNACERRMGGHPIR